MPGTRSIRLQTALVVLLFLGSLATVLVSAFQTLRLPQEEARVRGRLQEAGRRMAEAAAKLEPVPADGASHWSEFNARLRGVSARVLEDYPGVEGGFYLGGETDRFGGYAFPTGAEGAAPPRWSRGDDPPPREAPLILVAAQDSLSPEAEDFSFEAVTVGVSRVAIVTEPVGTGRPARMAAWVMFRLTDPESLAAQLRRSQLSTGLALGGIALAFVLTANLGRTLKRQRREQERLREDLRRAEHLAALGKLLAGVAHEVRNPLTGIRSTVQLWERLPDTARTEGSLKAVIRAVDQLNEIVSRLLYFARPDGAVRESVDVNQVLGETLKLLEAQAASQSVRLELDLEPRMPAVSGSAGSLRQVFLNLATNALHAMPHGGRLGCRTTYQRQTRTIEVRFSDTGPGVSPEDRRHLFEPFFTTRPEGTGLGLALCREIALQHGGSIELEPGTGAGAIFRLVLPAAG
jgi:signal transduction histidine kinase